MSETAARLTAALAGRYEIERELGAGGMATVFLARDVRHDRRVAIKVLHPEIAVTLGGDRFVTEIKTTAMLQHPHILSLLDSGVADGLFFYVMPLVSGDSLRERLRLERQLPVEDAVRIASEVADALSHAHQHGIVHRDIKPENILLQSGHAVVADFGIALAVQEAGEQRLTQTGLSLGTPSYMSPEQAMGERTIDSRSDIYSLGAVLHEMLAGEPPFTGPSVQAIFAKVITEKPVPLSALRDTVPLHVERAVLKALSKLPADRFANASGFATAFTAPTSFASSAAPQNARRSRSRTALTLLGGGALVAAAWALGRFANDNDGGGSAAPVFLELALPTFVATYDRGFAISRDGQSVAYTGSQAGVTDIRITRLSDGTIRTLPGTSTAMQPFFSPDGKHIGYRSLVDGHVYRASADGSVRAEYFTTARFIHNAYFTWVATDTLFAASVQGIYRLIAGTNIIDTLHVFGPDDGYSPTDVSRAGDVLLISTNRPAIQTLAFNTRSKTLGVFARGFWHATPLPSGSLLIASASGDLLAGKFDPSGMKLADNPVPVLRGLQGMTDTPLIAISPSGTLVHVIPSPDSRLIFVDRTGHVEARASVCLRTPRFSPNGLFITGTQGGGCSGESGVMPSVWVYEIARDLATRIWVGPSGAYPTFTPDGQRVVFSAYPDGVNNEYDLFALDVTGGSRSVFLAAPQQQRDISFTRDALLAAYRVRNEGEQNDIWLLDRRTTPPTSRALLNSTSDEVMPSIAPNGEWLVYVSDKTGIREVWLTDFPAATRHYQVSRDGGNEPAWGPDTRELYYRHGNEMMSVTLADMDPVTLGTPRLLFRGNYVESSLGRMYDVSPDGKRFVFEEASPTNHVRVILNWFSTWPRELRP